MAQSPLLTNNSRYQYTGSLPGACSALNHETDRILFAAISRGTPLFAIASATAAIGGNLDLLGLMVLAFSTAVGGGILRDLLIGDVPPAALHMILGRKLRLPPAWSALLGGLVCFFLRLISVWLHWNLPRVMDR